MSTVSPLAWHSHPAQQAWTNSSYGPKGGTKQGPCIACIQGRCICSHTNFTTQQLSRHTLVCAQHRMQQGRRHMLLIVVKPIGDSCTSCDHRDMLQTDGHPFQSLHVASPLHACVSCADISQVGGLHSYTTIHLQAGTTHERC